MVDLTLQISGTGTRDGRTEIISATHEHMEGTLAFAWKANAEHGDRYDMTCDCHGMWNEQKFAAVLDHMATMMGHERFCRVLEQLMDFDKYRVEEDGQDEQVGAD